MAIFIPGETKCSLCEGSIADGQTTVSTSHFISKPSHPLWRYSDTVMHYPCFQHWKQRGTFVNEYNRSIEAIIWDHSIHHWMDPDGTIRTSHAPEGGHGSS